MHSVRDATNVFKMLNEVPSPPDSAAKAMNRVGPLCDGVVNVRIPPGISICVVEEIMHSCWTDELRRRMKVKHTKRDDRKSLYVVN